MPIEAVQQNHSAIFAAKILIVEDDPAIRNLLRLVLGRQYRLLIAHSPKDALRMCEEESEPIDLLITDVNLPGIGGEKLAECIAASRPKTRVIYISGFDVSALTQTDTIAVMQKPFMPQKLLDLVETLLAR